MQTGGRRFGATRVRPFPASVRAVEPEARRGTRRWRWVPVGFGALVVQGAGTYLALATATIDGSTVVPANDAALLAGEALILLVPLILGAWLLREEQLSALVLVAMLGSLGMWGGIFTHAAADGFAYGAEVSLLILSAVFGPGVVAVYALILFGLSRAFRRVRSTGPPPERSAVAEGGPGTPE